MLDVERREATSYKDRQAMRASVDEQPGAAAAHHACCIPARCEHQPYLGGRVVRGAAVFAYAFWKHCLRGWSAARQLVPVALTICRIKCHRRGNRLKGYAKPEHEYMVYL